MAEDMPTTPSNSNIPSRKSAPDVLLEFLKQNNMSVIVRRQQVRFLEDNGMVIEPPSLTVFYNDELEKKLNKEDKPSIDLPPAKK